jgi:hypothetical protein
MKLQVNKVIETRTAKLNEVTKTPFPDHSDSDSDNIFSENTIIETRKQCLLYRLMYIITTK